MIWWPFTRETIFCLMVFIDLKHILLSSLMEAKSRIERVLSAAGFITAESVQQLQSCSHFFTPHIFRFCQLVVTYGSTYVLVALSVDRYDAITHPMRFNRSCECWSAPVSSLIITTNNYCRQQSKVVGFLSMGDQHHLLCTDPLLLPH